ncbi:MAG: cysteine hydrolase [Ignavibacteria bacterium]|nr:cysteine hydrolase [Ignavibacteria bacterium]
MKTLLLIDFQNDYFEGGTNPLLGSIEAVTKAAKLLNYFRNNNLPVVHVQHLANRAGATFFIPGTPGAEIHNQVAPLPTEPIILKHVPNSFLHTRLQDVLCKYHTSELVICGMMTHMCIDATVRAAKDLGHTVTLVADACATKDLAVLGRQIPAAEVHHAFLAALGYFYADIRNASEIVIQ